MSGRPLASLAISSGDAMALTTHRAQRAPATGGKGNSARREVGEGQIRSAFPRAAMCPSPTGYELHRAGQALVYPHPCFN